MTDSKRPELRLELTGQDGKTLTLRDWTKAEIKRSLTDISGGFQLEYDDQDRMANVLPRPRERFDLVFVRPWMKAALYLDNELVLLGYVDDVDFEVTGDQVRATLSGRDVTGQLVDCSANPTGPAEYKGLTLTEIARKLCAPFGIITVRAEVDVGAPFTEFGIDLGESVHGAIDKAARQRGILVTSDGVGGLVLTRSGQRQAPGVLRLGTDPARPTTVISGGSQLSGRERFSDYWVKGQARHQRRGRRAALDGTVSPMTARPPPGSGTASHSRRASTGPLDGTVTLPGSPAATTPPATTPRQRERPPIISTGHAVDPRVPLYRPKVFVARTQSGGAPNQVLAEWRMRIARGKSTRNRWTVPGWRAGDEPAGGRLWRPNELVAVETGTADPLQQLIASVAYSQSDREGSRTRLETVGREAYDLEPLPDKHGRGKHRTARAADVGNTRRGAPGGDH